MDKELKKIIIDREEIPFITLSAFILTSLFYLTSCPDSHCADWASLSGTFHFSSSPVSSAQGKMAPEMSQPIIASQQEWGADCQIHTLSFFFILITVRSCKESLGT